jgi:tripartite-type tricarboxylate transporter receptor subunit TctC
MKRVVVAFLGALGFVIGSCLAHAQEYPAKTITMIVPYAPGGSTDVLGRVLAQAMGNELKQQIIVENVGGGGGTIGTGRVARSPGDGYTILFHNMGHSIAPALHRKLAYNPMTDFEPLGLVTDVPMILVARKDFPAKDLKEVLAYVKANKDKVSFANGGAGSTSHLCGLLFMTAIETDVTSVPYKGSGPALNDLMGGQVDFLCDQPVITSSPIKGGKVKAYGVAAKTRVSVLPQVPTLDEAGLPGFEIAVWHGLYAPKRTPKPVIDKLSAGLQQALRDPTLKQRFAELGTEPVAQARVTPEALRAHLKAEIDKWDPIIKKAGVYAD